MKIGSNKSRCYHRGMAWYKWFFIKPLIKQQFADCACLYKWRDSARDDEYASHLFVWGCSAKQDVKLLRQTGSIPKIYSVEDGFIRSLGLGSALSRPLSLVMDSRGIYYDPTQESDLEYILQHQTFPQEVLTRAEVLIGKITTLKLSKYNHQKEASEIGIKPSAGQKVILVPGQVDDDMSIKYGAFGMTNLKLLQEVRLANPQAYIIYKPHPDVLANNRKGDLKEQIPLQFADIVIRDIGIDSVLGLVTEVHTMTSLVGFEALIRGKQVYTYGLPFYAGWGLTHDKLQCERRTRSRSLTELAAAALIEYPKYFHPKSKQPATPEVVVEYLAAEKQKLQKKPVKRALLSAQSKVLPKVRQLLKIFKLG